MDRISRLSRILGQGVAGLLLAVLTLWLLTYFWLGSTPGRARLARAIGEASPAIEVGVVRWGPAPGSVTVGGLGLKDSEGKTLVALRFARADLALLPLLTGDLVVDRLQLELSHVLANIDREGRVDLLMAISPPRPQPAASSPPRPPGERPTISIGELDLRVDRLHIVTPDAELLFVNGVHASGRVHLGPSTAVEGRLTLSTLEATWDRWRRRLGLDRLVVDVRLDGGSLHLSRIEATRGGEPIALAELRVAPDGTIRVGADAVLSGADTEAFAPGLFPFGLDVTGLALEITPPRPAAPPPRVAEPTPDGAPPPSPDDNSANHLEEERDPGSPLRVTGRVAQIHAPLWRTSTFSASQLDLALDAIDVEVKRLIPRVEVKLGHLHAARVSALGWDLHGLDLPGGRVAFQRRLEVLLGPGHLADWRMGDDLSEARPLPTELVIAADLGLTGGPLHARLVGEFGLIDAIGRLRVSPLSGRTSFSTTLRFSDLAGPPLSALLHDLEAERLERIAAASRPSGRAVFELAVSRERDADGAPRLEPTITWDEGRIDVPGGPSYFWDGYGWDEGPATTPDPSNDSSDDDEVSPAGDSP